MGWVKNIAGLGLAAGVFGAVAGLWGPDDIKEAARRGVDGGFAVGEGIAEAVPDNVGRILTEKGYDVENMTTEDWADAAADKTIEWGDAGLTFLQTYAGRLGFEPGAFNGYVVDDDGICLPEERGCDSGFDLPEELPPPD